MSKPEDMGITGQELYDNTQPAQYAEQKTDYAWAKFLATLSELLDPIAVVTRPRSGEEQWTVLGSPSRCPREWLPVLAQWAGVRRPDTMREEDLRILIGPHGPGMWRGTKQAMTASVARFLPEGAPIYFEERADGDPYLFRVFIWTYSGGDAEQIRSTLLHEKPAGLTLEFDVRVGQTWGMLKQRKATWGDVMIDYPDWHEVKYDEPVIP